MFQEGPFCRASVGHFGGDWVDGRGACFHPGVRFSVGRDDFRRPPYRDFRCQALLPTLAASLCGDEFPRRRVGEGDARAALRRNDCQQVVRDLALEERVFYQRARRHDTHDLAAHDSLRGRRVLHLLADGDLDARLDELGQVAVEGVVRDARERHLLLGPLVPRSQDDTQHLGRDLGVLAEGLVEVPEAEEQQRPWMLRLDCLILGHKRGFVRQSPGLPSDAPLKSTALIRAFLPS